MTDNPVFTSLIHRDDLLLRELSLGDEEALRSLVEIFGRYVYGKALQVVHDAEIAEEVAQETLLVLWWRPHRFDPSKGSLLSFLMGESRSRAIDLMRDEEVTRDREALLSEASLFLDSPPGDDETAESVSVRSAISDLASNKREVVFLAFYKGLTYPQVASVLSVSEDTVNSRIQECFVRLRESFNLDHDRHSA